MGSFEHIEAPICADVVEAVAGIAALHIEPEGFAEAVGAALVGMAGDAVFIRTHENRIVVIGVFIQQFLSCKVRHNAPVDIPVLDQIGIDPAHIGIGRRKDKGLRRLLYPFFGRGINRSQLASQKHGHRLRISHRKSSATSTSSGNELSAIQRRISFGSVMPERCMARSICPLDAGR